MFIFDTSCKTNFKTKLKCGSLNPTFAVTANCSRGNSATLLPNGTL